MAERAISTRKSNFVPDISGTDKLLQMHLWDRIIYQAQITLNILRPSRSNPKVSAHAMMEINFNFKKTSLEPSGTKVIFHEEPNRRSTWVQHGVQEGYIVPVVEHYRRYKAYISNIREERITDTVKLFPENTTIPVHVETELIRVLRIQHHPPRLHS